MNKIQPLKNTYSLGETKQQQFIEALVAVVIQFNTEAARWAICMKENQSIKTFSRTWAECTEQTISDWLPLDVVVRKDDKTIKYVGTMAEELYEELQENNDEGQYLCFRNIVSKLLKAFKENDDLQLQDEYGKSLPALTVFTLLLDFFKNDIHKKAKEILERDKHYVLIVPEMFQVVGAIDFIRKVAMEAGINPQMLSVVTEIDAVSLFHQKELAKQKQDKNKKKTLGKKFLIIRAGDSSTSIVVQESTDERVVKEITPLQTKEGGGKILKRAFKQLFSEVFQKDVFTTFKSESNQEWRQMENELIKKTFLFEPYESSITRFHLPVKLQQNLDDLHISKMKSANKGSIKVFADKMSFSSEILEEIIIPSVRQVILDIQNYIEKEAGVVEEIVIFGEFTKVEMFKQSVVKHFHEKNLVLYEDVKETALTGAGIIGLGLGQINKFDRVKSVAIVAAIDFGTTYSGWAYSIRANFELDRTKASTKLWNSGSSQTEKAPTCILIGQDGKTVEAFGYEAEDRYQDLAETEDHKDFYYFRRFKMLLNKKLGEKLDRNMTLEDPLNRSLLAIDVFSMSIKFLKEDLLSVLTDRHLGNIKMDDIHWVLTVPAIWTDGSKQFMREAAIMAGITSKRLTIALEPEAASMYCRILPIEASTSDSGINISSLSIGTQYMILDAGGGTVDITVHEVDTDNNVKEIHAASGGGWGGTTVDEEFKELITTLVTKEVYEQFKRDNTDDWHDIWRDFEVKKRTITVSSTSPLRMKLPSSLTDKYYHATKEKLADVIKRSEYANEIQIVRDKINFSPKLSKSWFKTSVDQTVSLVESILSKNENIKAILMVGGFSESPVLQNAIRSAFNTIDVIIPSEASSCILKGALIFGHMPKSVTERVLRYTYGIESFEKFVPGHHPMNRRITTDNGDVCTNVFSKHAEIYQRVKLGERQVWQAYSPQYKSQKVMTFYVFASQEPNPKYTDEECFFVGTLQIDLADHDGALDREILVAFTFSGTEIVVEAKDKKSGNQSFVAVDFLG